MTSRRGNSSREGSILLDCVTVLMILSIGYLGVVRSFSVSVNSLKKQNARIERDLKDGYVRKILYTTE